MLLGGEKVQLRSPGMKSSVNIAHGPAGVPDSSMHPPPVELELLLLVLPTDGDADTDVDADVLVLDLLLDVDVVPPPAPVVPVGWKSSGLKVQLAADTAQRQTAIRITRQPMQES